MPPKIVRLAELIARLAEKTDHCDRESLRQAYGEWHRSEQKKSPSVTAAIMGDERRHSRDRNAVQSFNSSVRGLRWDSNKKRQVSSKGSSATMALADDLVRLERRGAVCRVGAETVRVLDWVALLAVINGAVQDATEDRDGAARRP